MKASERKTSRSETLHSISRFSSPLNSCPRAFSSVDWGPDRWLFPSRVSVTIEKSLFLPFLWFRIFRFLFPAGCGLEVRAPVDLSKEPGHPFSYDAMEREVPTTAYRLAPAASALRYPAWVVNAGLRGQNSDSWKFERQRDCQCSRTQHHAK